LRRSRPDALAEARRRGERRRVRHVVRRGGPGCAQRQPEVEHLHGTVRSDPDVFDLAIRIALEKGSKK